MSDFLKQSSSSTSCGVGMFDRLLGNARKMGKTQLERAAFIEHIAKIFDVPLKFLNVEPMPPLYSDFGLCPVHGIVRWCSCWDEKNSRG